MSPKNLLSFFVALAIFVVGSSLLVASKAQARWYLSANAGGTLLMDTSMTDAAGSSSASGSLDFDPGFAVTAATGYAWGGFRLEGELSYRDNALNVFNVTSVTTGGITTPGSTDFNLGGSLSAFGFMANAWYDYQINHKWMTFIGGGAGGAETNLKINSISVGGTVAATSFNDSEVALVYQAGAGIGYNVNPKSTIMVSYRLFNTLNKLDFFDSGEEIKVNYKSHSIMFGTVIKF